MRVHLSAALNHSGLVQKAYADPQSRDFTTHVVKLTQGLNEAKGEKTAASEKLGELFALIVILSSRIKPSSRRSLTWSMLKLVLG